MVKKFELSVLRVMTKVSGSGGKKKKIIYLKFQRPQAIFLENCFNLDKAERQNENEYTIWVI